MLYVRAPSSDLCCFASDSGGTLQLENCESLVSCQFDFCFYDRDIILGSERSGCAHVDGLEESDESNGRIS